LYDLLIKGGLLLDSASGLSEKMDIAITRDKVDAVEHRISDGSARRTLDAKGLVVAPGLIDLHTHVAWEVVGLGIDPYSHCLLRGTTTAVDAGSTGELNFRGFKRYVIDQSKVRILALLNIESLGMIEFADVKPWYTTQEWPSLLTSSDEKFVKMFINAKETERTIEQNRKTIMGIKWAHHGIKGMAMARRSADAAKCKLMIENKFMPEASHYVRKGDMVTHIFHNAFDRHSGRKDGLLQDGKIPGEFFKMLKAGVVFDVGHGKGSFSWDVAGLALKEGIRPTTISSDLWSGNIDGPVYDLPTVMSKFLHLGMSLEEVFAASTAAPASVIGRGDELGTLKPGVTADVAVFKVREGSFSLEDCYGKVRKAGRRIVPVHVVRAGEVVLEDGKPNHK